MASKYKAKPCMVNGIRYASQKEAAYCQQLKMLQCSGLIHSLMLQPKYPVWINSHKCFTYIADATYVENDKQVIVDVKGVKTPMYRLKKKCVEAYYGVTITEV